MSELMTPIPFRQLMTWIVAEHDREGSVFGIHRPFRPSGKTLTALKMQPLLLLRFAQKVCLLCQNTPVTAGCSGGGVRV